MKKYLTKAQLLTIPNLLSLIRIGLVPLILWLYCVRAEYACAAGVIMLSGATDVVDGYVARRFRMVSDVGKVLDPVADKLTQAAVILCLTVKHRRMYLLIALFAAKELTMLVLGILTFKRKDAVNSARWYGKVNTVVIYAVVLVLILYPAIPELWANRMIDLSAGVMSAALILYFRFYLLQLRAK